MAGSSRYAALVDDARSRIREATADEIKSRIDGGEAFYLIDVREEGEWHRGRIPGANWMGKGILERDIERAIPDTEAEIVLYCGGGSRSALAANNLLRMGYTNVSSMNGGIGGWMRAGYPVDR